MDRTQQSFKVNILINSINRKNLEGNSRPGAGVAKYIRRKDK